MSSPRAARGQPAQEVATTAAPPAAAAAPPTAEQQRASLDASGTPAAVNAHVWQFIISSARNQVDMYARPDWHPPPGGEFLEARLRRAAAVPADNRPPDVRNDCCWPALASPALHALCSRCCSQADNDCSLATTMGGVRRWRRLWSLQSCCAPPAPCCRAPPPTLWGWWIVSWWARTATACCWRSRRWPEQASAAALSG